MGGVGAGWGVLGQGGGCWGRVGVLGQGVGVR